MSNVWGRWPSERGNTQGFYCKEVHVCLHFALPAARSVMVVCSPSLMLPHMCDITGEGHLLFLFLSHVHYMFPFNLCTLGEIAKRSDGPMPKYFMYFRVILWTHIQKRMHFFFQVALFQLPDVTLMISVYNKRSMKRKEMLGWFSLGLSSTGHEEMAHWSDMRDNRCEQVCRWHVLIDS
jgi:hypothetical protein